MADNLSREDEFLLKEYDTATQLTFHVDEMRSRFTNLFITFVGAAAAAVSLLIEGTAKTVAFGNFETVLGIFLLLLAVAGTYFWTFVLILLNSYVVALGIYLLLHNPLLAAIGTLLLMFLQDRLYIGLAAPPKPREYSRKSPPDQDSQPAT